MNLDKSEKVAPAKTVHGSKTFTDLFMEEFEKEIGEFPINVILVAHSHYLAYSNKGHSAEMIFMNYKRSGESGS